LDNHGYLGGPRGRWLTIEGGCRQYVRAFQSSFRGTVHADLGVARVNRREEGVEVQLADGASHLYDKVVIAVHADQALKLLSHPTERERRLLGAWRYHKTPTVLHQDASAMPSDPRRWSSWNIRYDSSGESADRNQITYYLNRVQGLRSRRDYFVTLGGANIPDKSVLARFDYEHPVYDFRAVATQGELPRLNEGSDVLFCGSYFGYGFHEDAVRSAAEIARSLGASDF
jgi:predicted NAD/FAD-binding protein